MELSHLRLSLQPMCKENTWTNTNNVCKDMGSKRLAILEAKREAFEEQLLSVLEGDFALIAPPSVVDALEARNMPNMQVGQSPEQSDEEEQSLSTFDDPSASLSFNDITDSFESEGIDDWLLH